jgi:hypothetical protein
MEGYGHVHVPEKCVRNFGREIPKERDHQEELISHYVMILKDGNEHSDCIKCTCNFLSGLVIFNLGW